jgi:hypothetical protein
MNHYVTLALTNRKSSIHLHDLYSPRTALRMFTPRRDHLMVCVLYILQCILRRYETSQNTFTSLRPRSDQLMSVQEDKVLWACLLDDAVMNSIS